MVNKFNLIPREKYAGQPKQKTEHYPGLIIGRLTLYWPYSESENTEYLLDDVIDLPVASQIPQLRRRRCRRSCASR